MWRRVVNLAGDIYQQYSAYWWTVSTWCSHSSFSYVLPVCIKIIDWGERSRPRASYLPPVRDVDVTKIKQLVCSKRLVPQDGNYFERVVSDQWCEVYFSYRNSFKMNIHGVCWIKPACSMYACCNTKQSTKQPTLPTQQRLMVWFCDDL